MPLLLIGFDFAAFAGYIGLLTLFAIFLHSNVPWSFGRLRYVVASPVFHRWHHTTEKEGIDRLIAGAGGDPDLPKRSQIEADLAALHVVEGATHYYIGDDQRPKLAEAVEVVTSWLADHALAGSAPA